MKQKKTSKLPKTLTGIAGLDDITRGGLPQKRATLIAGGPGSGKTILALEFLVKGITEYNEHGVFLTFEENANELTTNMVTLSFDLNTLIAKNKLHIEHIEMDRTEILETGQFDLEGLFVRLEHAIDKVGAKRVVLDSLNALFHQLKYDVLRRELNRLCSWLKKKGMTTILTVEAGKKSLTEQGLEEYVADCVMLLSNRVVNQISTRRLRIIKYRGSIHGVNEYPFTISEKGIEVFPIIPEIHDINVSEGRISSGIKSFDEMLGGKGFFQGSSILVSGSAGTGKSSLAASLVNAICKKKDRCLYCAFEESPKQIVRNMRSIDIDLQRYLSSGNLQFYFYRPTLQNLELHLIKIQKIIEEFKPAIVILDPVTNIMSEGINSEIRYMLVKFVDFVKSRQITVLFTAAITLETIKSNASDEGISSMVDTWILLTDIEQNAERNRCLSVLKSRGMKHSAQIREFVITDNGIDLIPVFIADGKILTGSSKMEYSNKEKARHLVHENEIKTNNRVIEYKRKAMGAAVAKLKAMFDSTVAELNKTKDESRIAEEVNNKDKNKLLKLRNKGEAKKQEGTNKKLKLKQKKWNREEKN